MSTKQNGRKVLAVGMAMMLAVGIMSCNLFERGGQVAPTAPGANAGGGNSPG